MSKIVTSSFLSDKDKLSLTQDDLFDRIINLKLTTGEYVDTSKYALPVVHDTYVIRSDYEVFYPNLDVTKVMRTGSIPSKNYYIRKCQLKPSIKVQYKKVSNSTSIEVDIFVSNFFMVSSSGEKLLSFNYAEYPLKKVELMMGYWGQFKNFPHETWEDLQKFEPGFGIEKITVDVNYVVTEKLPPDCELHIHGYVGTSAFAPSTGVNAVTDFSKLETEEVPSEDSYLPDLFYKHITRRFRREAVVDKQLNIDKETGLMSDADADEYGIKVFCSEEVKKMQIKSKKDSSGGTTNNKIFFNSGVTADNTFNQIISLVSGRVIKTSTLEGNWIVYTEKESGDIPELLKSVKKINPDYTKNNMLEKHFAHILPAVYNINVDALSTVVSPFFFFTEPFDYFIFKNRYALSTQVTYWADVPNASYDTYYIIQQSVSFATVDNVNEVTYVCVAEKEEHND